jgi:ribosomal protein S18 acetylase RimI-like enzyme
MISVDIVPFACWAQGAALRRKAMVMLTYGDLTLRRAVSGDFDRVVAIQHAAYARNRALLGVEPLPLLVDYEQIFRDYEVWVTAEGIIESVLILEPRADDLLIWSIATDPQRQQAGLGHAMLMAAEIRARELGRSTMRLYTGAILHHLTGWYRRHGYAIERIEERPDRTVAHMVKQL